jgi:hypothetical protein
MTQRDHIRIVTGWLTDLANLTAGTAPLADAKGKIYALSLALSEEFPYAATFTKVSLYHVSRAATFFPAHAVLSKLLGEWWDANRPREVPLPPSDIDPKLQGNDRFLAEQWWRKRPDRVGKMEFATAVDLLRKSPAAFREVCAKDREAEKIAMRRGWLEDVDRAARPMEVRHRDDWGGIDPPAIATKLADIREVAAQPGPMAKGLAMSLLSFLRTAVANYAPQHSHLIPARLDAEERRRTPDEQIAELGSTGPNAAEFGPAPDRGPSMVDQRAMLAQLRANPALPNRAERISDILAQWHGHPGFEPLASDPPLYPTPPPAPPPANDTPATEDTGLWTPSWMTDAAD